MSVAPESSTASSSLEDNLPTLLASEPSIIYLVQKLLEHGFYQFVNPELLKDQNQFIFSMTNNNKSFMNPAFGSSKLYQEYKSRFLTASAPNALNIPVRTTKPLSEIPPESAKVIDLDALLAYCFHRSTSPYLSLEDTGTLLSFKEPLPEINIPAFFDIPLTDPEERIPLTQANLVSILEEKYFIFRTPSDSHNKIFINMKSGLFLSIIAYNKKNNISSDDLFKENNVVIYQKQFYLRLPLEEFTERFTLQFLMDYGTRWEINNDDFI